MGIVKKNAIMMIDFLLEAEGAAPLVLESGSGAELRLPPGIATSVACC